MKNHPEREEWPMPKFSTEHHDDAGTPKSRAQLEAALHQRDPSRLPAGYQPLTLQEAIEGKKSPNS